MEMKEFDKDNKIIKLENKVSSLELDLKTKTIFNYGLIAILVFVILYLAVNEVRLYNERSKIGYSKEVETCIEFEKWKQNR